MVTEYPVQSQDVGDKVVSEDCQTVDVVEPAGSLPIEGEVKVGDGNLRAFEKLDVYPFVECRIIEEGQPGKKFYQLLGGVSG